MKLSDALFNGLARTSGSLKAIVITWFFSLLLTSLIAIPLRTWVNTVFGKSMITGLLAEGFVAGIIPDMGHSFLNMISFFSSGLFLLVLVWFIANVFLTGGMFSYLKQTSAGFCASEFFRAAAYNFRPFFIIMLIMSIIIVCVISIIMIVPAVIVSMPETVKEGSVFKTLVICTLISSFTLMIFILVTDYARAWKSEHTAAGIKAIGIGFRQVFRHFGISISFILVIVILQLLFTWLSFRLIFSMKPSTDGGLFLFFLASQLLFFIKIALRIWRYAGVTVLMEMTQEKILIADQHQEMSTGDKPGTDFII